MTFGINQDLTQLEYQSQVADEIDRLDLEPVVTKGMSDLQASTEVNKHLAFVLH